MLLYRFKFYIQSILNVKILDASEGPDKLINGENVYGIY